MESNQRHSLCIENKQCMVCARRRIENGKYFKLIQNYPVGKT